MSEYHTIPNPKGASAGSSYSAVTSKLMSILTRWRPRNAPASESMITTMARYAMRLVSIDGSAYTPEDLRPSRGTPTLATFAANILTGTTIAAGDTVTIGANTYTFVDALTTDPDPVPFEVLVGETDSASLDNLIAAINGDSGEGITYGEGTTACEVATAAAGAGDTLELTASTIGSAGNQIATTSDLTAGGWESSTLEGGQNATPAKAGEELYDDNFRYLCTSDVSSNSTSGWKKSALSSL